MLECSRRQRFWKESTRSHRRLEHYELQGTVQGWQACEHWNILHPGAKQRESYVAAQLKDTEGVLVAASDYVKALPDSISQWMPRPLIALGPDGYGRSESRASLRDFFQVDAKHIVLATLTGLLRDGKIKAAEVKKAITDLGIDSESPDPFSV